MSYVKVNRSFHGPGKRPVRSKRVTKTKPKQEWVGTIHDLTVHKATPEELSRRHEIHQSKNRTTVQLELRERAFKRRLRRSHPSSPTLDYGQQCIIREYQLQDTLAKSDQATAVAKDLFGDAPRRQTGFPSVTVAPCCGHRSELPLRLRAEPLAQMFSLNQLAGDTQALNELDGHSEDEGSEHIHSSLNTLNFNRHTKWLKQRLQEEPHSGEQGQGGRLNLDPEASQSSCSSPCAESESQQTALNETVAVQRVQARTAPPESDSTSALISQVLNPKLAPTKKPDKKTKPCGISRRQYVSRLNSSALSSLSGNQSSLEVLQGMLGEVEKQLDSVAPSEAPVSSGNRQGAPSLTGFSMSLVSSLGRLARQLRQCHEDVQKEVEDRKSLNEELREQRKLVDALTIETLSLREDNIALQKQLKEMDQRLSTLVLALDGLGDLGRLETEERLRSPNAHVCESCVISDGDPNAEIHEQMLLSPAVLLSPPRQMDSQPHRTQAAQDQSLQYKDVTTRGMNAMVLEVDGHNQLDSSQSILSFATLPHLPPSWESSTVHTHCGISVRDSHPDTVHNQQNFSHGIAPVSESTETRAASRIGHRTAWVMTRMEERLLELNRQSVAAKNKLLALIEQQKQEAVGGASPSISPVPLATSEWSPHVVLSLPERDVPADSNWGSRCV
ncbi:spindle and centriole-associated protein 1 isoform X2 [Arapaima gigas]